MITRAPRISKREQGMLFKCFSMDLMASKAAEIAGVSRPCANRWYEHWREIIYKSTRRAPRFSGEVEMDVAYFGGGNRKKVRAALKRVEGLPHTEYLKKSREIRMKHRIRVLGIMQRGGDVYLQIIKSEAKSSLMPIIRLVVERRSSVYTKVPGRTAIYTDKWRGFADIALDGYTHNTVNHSLEYANKKGHHINSIESFWGAAKGRLAKFNGLHRRTLPLHLKECEFRWNHRDDFAKAFDRIDTVSDTHTTAEKPKAPRK